jgi:hypothetical protein
MRYPAAEKFEIIRTVEASPLPVSTWAGRPSSATSERRSTGQREDRSSRSPVRGPAPRLSGLAYPGRRPSPTRAGGTEAANSATVQIARLRMRWLVQRCRRVSL